MKTSPLLLMWLALPAWADAPAVTTTVEPWVGFTLTYLATAPSSAGQPAGGQLSPKLTLRNDEAAAITLDSITIDFPGSAVPGRDGGFALNMNPGATRGWMLEPADDFDLPAAAPSTMRVRSNFTGYSDPVTANFLLAKHVSPTPTGASRFWGRVGDLNPGEFWIAQSGIHGKGTGGSQVFGYDVGVQKLTGGGYSSTLPDTDGTENSHFYAWGKPIYAVRSGTVLARRNDWPTNPDPAAPSQAILDAITDAGDGNGNFFTIGDADETVLYAHMQPGSLNPALGVGSYVAEGTFLGRLGNTGAVWGAPHLHIHANETDPAPDPQSWVGAPRPLPFYGARAVAASALAAAPSIESAPWSPLDGVGIPLASSAIWPSAQAAETLAHTTVKDFAIHTNGQLWTVATSSAIRTTSDRFPNAQGIYLDVNPGGLAKGIALSNGAPYVIGTDNTVWKGTPSGWVPLSMAAKRIAGDEVTGKIWIISLDDSIHSYTPATDTWATYPGNGAAKDICAYNGTPYVVGMNNTIYKGTGAGWTQVSTFTGKRIAFGGSKLWVTGYWDDHIYSAVPGQVFVEHAGGGVAWDITYQGGVPYVLGTDQHVWKSAGANGWTHINVVQP